MIAAVAYLSLRGKSSLAAGCKSPGPPLPRKVAPGGVAAVVSIHRLAVCCRGLADCSWTYIFGEVDGDQDRYKEPRALYEGNVE